MSKFPCRTPRRPWPLATQTRSPEPPTPRHPPRDTGRRHLPTDCRPSILETRHPTPRPRHSALMTRSFLCLPALLVLLALTGAAADWPQFLGPNRNGAVADTLTAWPK